MLVLWTGRAEPPAANMLAPYALLNGFIEFIDYLERMPDERIPRKAELITKLKEAQQGMQMDAQYEEMAKFLESLPPEQQQQILALPPEQQEQAVMQLMKGEKVA